MPDVPLGDERSRLRYAAAKFADAEAALALGVGPIKQRLRDAWGRMHVVQESDLPEALRPQLRELKAALTITPRQLTAMRTAKAVAIARNMRELGRLIDEADRA